MSLARDPLPRITAACALGATLAWTVAASAPAAEAPPRVEKNVPAAMRDGVVLRADVYRPGGAGPHPVLLHRTPYSKNAPERTRRAEWLSARGYVVVVQDTRGRYTSDGVAIPHDEAADGYDSVEWAASLPRVTGQLGMYGGSYAATTQLTAASLRPPRLAALAPSSSYSSRYDMVFRGGAFYLSDGLSWNLGQSVDARRRVSEPWPNRDAPAGLDEVERTLLERWLWHVPLKTLRAMDLPRFAPGYFRMLEHPSFDAFWRTFDIASRHDQFDVPALHVTGWYDSLLAGTLDNFAGLRALSRSAAAREGQRLVVGPWTHASPTTESTAIGDVSFGPDAGLDHDALLLDWFDAHLKARKAAPTPPVRLFVMGSDRWRDEQEWPLARARPSDLFLDSRGSANTAQGDGALEWKPDRGGAPDRFVYDPWDPVPCGASEGYSRTPANPRLSEKRRDILVYTSATLAEPLEVTGPVALTLWAASSARDTDFTAKLLDVQPDRAERTLTDGILRARYRRGKAAPELLVPGQPVELKLDLGATSNVFRAGHRIRLEVSSSCFPRFDRNPNTGGPFGEEDQLLTAEQTVFHDAARPSRLVLPVVR